MNGAIRQAHGTRIGYACMTVGVDHAALRSCTLKNASPERLSETIRSNLSALNAIFAYNFEQHIRMFRISSDLIPFGSHPDINFTWDECFKDELSDLGKQARLADVRLSMHPGQYTVLNSPDPSVVDRAIKDLVYHCRLLDCLGADTSAKLILHIGGAYGDKKFALARFADNYHKLDERIRDRLVIENDDKIFTIEDTLELGLDLGVPVVFDNLHNEVNPSSSSLTEVEWIEECSRTWQRKDGAQKTHYSQQALDKRPGSHSHTIDAKTFFAYLSSLPENIDIMLEVKDKNLSAVKCILCSESPGRISDLEKEWARYKYLVLEHSPKAYSLIRSLLKDKASYPVLDFYDLIDRAMNENPDAGVRINAAQHVWGYFRKKSNDQEKIRFNALLEKYINRTGSIAAIKRYLFKLAKKYDERYLLQSLYFTFD